MRAMLESCWEPSTLWNNCKAFLAPVPSCSTFSDRKVVSLFPPLILQHTNPGTPCWNSQKNYQQGLERPNQYFRAASIFILCSAAEVSRREALFFCRHVNCKTCLINFVSVFRAICSLLFCFCTAIPKDMSIKHHGELWQTFSLGF